MGSLSKIAIGGSIHRVREFELEKVSLVDEFDILQIVGEGWFGKILLVEHKATDTEMVLKALPKPYTSLKDFYREFHYGLHLSAHKNIISTYDVAFETAGFYVFSQEYAPLGDLTSNVSETGIGELHTKRVAKQLAAALEHLHSRDLVHRDIKLDNILVFKSDFSRIKLCDFGETRRAGTLVLRRNEWLPYAPPEILQITTDGNYMASTSHDVWQFGIVVFVCLTGCLPWQKAAMDDPRYARYLSWQASAIALGRSPKLFKLVSSKAQRLFKKYLEPRPEKRPAGLGEVYRYMDDRWMSKVGMEKNNEVAAEEEGLCPSMYSFHSSPEEKNKLLFTLTQYGLETTVDRSAKKDRIREWIQTSVIEEVNEEDEEVREEDIGIIDNQTGPIGERSESRGPISASKITNGQVKRHTRRHKRTPLPPKEPAIYTPPIDPRIPLEKQLERKKVHFNSNPEEITNSTTAVPPVASVFPLHSIIKQNSSYEIPEELTQQDDNQQQNAVRHKINVQVPQSDMYAIPLSPKQNHRAFNNRTEIEMNGGNHLTRDFSKRNVRSEVERKYSLIGNKSSSSNSTGKS
ncbi:serine/threonine-protein kinase sbk1 [Holotrichia oblita]|uniref:Serine/threonine-protein kinase sbk1 n=2 Tax=Holotrichia oblita TaxID=644536 RepID=A0ACB9TT96_HOLOL|nr:serine/threonine-protein kinase sbk1 [Holotrichia oblita]